MDSVELSNSWTEVARGRLALQWPPLLSMTAHAIKLDVAGIDVRAARSAGGVFLVEVLTNDFRNAGDPDQGTYTVLCFERSAEGHVCGVTLHEATADEIDAERRRANPQYRLGTMAGVSPAELVVVHENGDHYAALYRLTLWPRLRADGSLPAEPDVGDAQAVCYFPVRIEKNERLEGAYGFLHSDVQDAGGVATVRDLLLAVQRAGYTGDPVVRTLRRNKSIVPPPAEPPRAAARPLDEVALIFESAGGRFFAGVYEGAQIVPVELDALAFSAVRDEIAARGSFVRVGSAWLRPHLAALAHVQPDGQVVVASTPLAKPPKRMRTEACNKLLL